LQADALVEVIEQIREDAVETDGLVLRLAAFRPEQVIDIVVAGPADSEDVWDAGGIAAEILAFNGGLDEVECQQVAKG
jgi:hypothetical protein